ncbi:hypothetical protein [Dyella nitratireducens]|uniref:Secreted protein n=1 Tax=Dyella nitratireducens TaxID=1849580 RepID=A0ABQ1FP78_9GAMM|nr:hypothetical protein [Dyella nitratireducens]GGA21822.1 hypothetical protein GCM10010981_07460 [Dyella nitratireducens]GLQ44193.1 hypothetical protein GCM10007902_40430 [Dyella nitratireducens]
MRKLTLIATALALTGCLALSACNNQQDQAQQQAQQPQKLTKPSDPNDSKAWGAYLGQIVQSNMQGMTAPQPYAYLVPAGDTDDAKDARDRQLSNIQDIVARGVLPGNLLAVGGPDSGKTADVVTTAFKDAKAGSFKGVIVVVIGDKADEQRVEDVLKPTNATVRYIEM